MKYIYIVVVVVVCIKSGSIIRLRIRGTDVLN